MRKRSITIFLSVYAALCIAYGVGTSVIMPDNSDIIAAVGQESSQTSYLTSASDDVSETSRKESSVQKANEVDFSEPSSESSANSIDEISETESSVQEDVSTPAEPEPSVIQNNDTEQSEEQIEKDDGEEYAEEKLSLEEFLKSLRCSGCRHNCILFSPRCMNGARKANQAQTQYYELYGG